VLRSLLRAREKSYRPVGFLDPDPATRNRTLHGVRVLGTLDDLARVTAQHDVDVAVVALPPAHAKLAEEVRERCATLGVPAYAAATFVEMHFAGAALASAPSDAQPALGSPDTTPKA
jgi:FlaA1/EpsC-like NDP-sugar epimerase